MAMDLHAAESQIYWNEIKEIKMNAIVLYRISNWCYRKKLLPLAKLFRALIYGIHNCYIPYSATIGKGTRFGYKGIGVVIHARAQIGENCVIGQNVTIGGRAGHEGIPKVGNNVFIGAGAVILGGVRIGNNVTVGANAVVLTDIPDGCGCVGVPARIIQSENGKYGANA